MEFDKASYDAFVTDCIAIGREYSPLDGLKNKRRVIWSKTAASQLRAVLEHLRGCDPDGLKVFKKLLAHSVGVLRDRPLWCHDGQVPGTREIFPHLKFRLIFEFKGSQSVVLALVHASKRWPDVQSKKPL